jgi:hypothetical protein
MRNQMGNNETVFGWEIHPQLLKFIADYQHLWWRENPQCGFEQEDLFKPVYVKAIIHSGVAKLVRTPNGKSRVEPTPAYLATLQHVDKTVRLLRLPKAHTRGIEKEVYDALGLAVSIEPDNGEAGTLSIGYENFDQLDLIATKLKA